MSLTDRPRGDYRSAQHEGGSVQLPSALITLAQHARNERDAAHAVLRQAQARARAARAQADQLCSYRNEYHQRWSARFRQPASPELLQCYQGFVQRLGQAIDQQEQQLSMADARVQAATATLLQREQRLAAVGKLIERREASAALSARRREQRQLDESAARYSALAMPAHA